jgi:hypothetical protein
MGSITAGYASGKEVVATQSDREYACSDQENMVWNSLQKTALRCGKQVLQRPHVLRTGCFLPPTEGNQSQYHETLKLASYGIIWP